jgi:DNA mismatch repair protein MSH3
LKLKKEHPGIILMFEVGYKCLFYGEDSATASRELGVNHSTEHKLPSAMVPMDRRDLYLKTYVITECADLNLSVNFSLLMKGYKVGLVEQTETRALKKASSNRNTVFHRAVKHIYTAATYVDELGSADNDLAPTLMTVVEGKNSGSGSNERVALAVVITCPTTGEIIWDYFDGQQGLDHD